MRAKRITYKIWITFLLLALSTPQQAQDPHRFDAAIAEFDKIEIPNTNDKLAVFTGSSSIRFWQNLSEDCPEVPTTNTGFGGSQMSDLLFFIEQTVLRFEPEAIYIYEGDNDIAHGKSPEQILETTLEVVRSIHDRLPESDIYFIAAKPSPARWQFREKYIEFNGMLRDLCDHDDSLHFIDVWTPMISVSGRPEPSIFISDSLHMNRQGYLLWKEVICSSSE